MKERFKDAEPKQESPVQAMPAIAVESRVEDAPAPSRLRNLVANVKAEAVLGASRVFVQIPVETGREIRRSFIGNPMRIETTRFKRRFINVTQSPKLNKTLVGLVVFSYLLILGLMFAMRADLNQAPIMTVQLILMMLAGVVAAHASIAGERDRRSWDLLQVAPITQYQIVIGKFLGAGTMLLGIQAAFLPALLMSAQLSGTTGVVSYLVNFVLGELVCLSSGLFLSAGTIFLSSKMKNANATLVTAIASSVGLFVIVPMLFSVFNPSGALMDSFLASFHPFYWLVTLLTTMHGLEYPMSDTGVAAPLIFHYVLHAFLGVILYLALTGGSLFFTGYRLTRQRIRE